MIQLALIGIGAWGKNFISTINSFTGCRIKYICSKTQKSLNYLPGDYIKTTNYKELFKYTDIDGVIISTPGSTHYQIAKEFLKRGFNLLVEKPLTTNYKDALELKSLRDNSKSKVLVGHVYLFDPAFIKAKKLVQDIGPIQYLSYEILNNGPYRSDMSVLWDLGPHPISLFLDIYQKEPIQIRAWGLEKLRPKTDLYDLVFINLRFSDHSQAFVKIGWLFPVKKRELVVVGSKSTIVYNDLESKKVTYYQNMGPKVHRKVVLKSHPTISYPTYNLKFPLEMEIREFIDAILENRDVKRSNLDFGVRVTKLLHLAEQSIKDEGKLINIS